MVKVFVKVFILYYLSVGPQASSTASSSLVKEPARSMACRMGGSSAIITGKSTPTGLPFSSHRAARQAICSEVYLRTVRRGRSAQNCAAGGLLRGSTTVTSLRRSYSWLPRSEEVPRYRNRPLSTASGIWASWARPTRMAARMSAWIANPDTRCSATFTGRPVPSSVVVSPLTCATDRTVAATSQGSPKTEQPAVSAASTAMSRCRP
mmetsp:Transcript_9273/g.20127  ORF Transcript_9273/g.20127 Transcript_9273/m.20127 type:complete len:207 (-) Transcript_9273:1332-1952(-)